MHIGGGRLTEKKYETPFFQIATFQSPSHFTGPILRKRDHVRIDVPDVVDIGAGE